MQTPFWGKSCCRGIVTSCHFVSLFDNEYDAMDASTVTKLMLAVIAVVILGNIKTKGQARERELLPKRKDAKRKS